MHSKLAVLITRAAYKEAGLGDILGNVPGAALDIAKSSPQGRLAGWAGRTLGNQYNKLTDTGVNRDEKALEAQRQNLLAQIPLRQMRQAKKTGLSPEPVTPMTKLKSLFSKLKRIDPSEFHDAEAEAKRRSMIKPVGVGQPIPALEGYLNMRKQLGIPEQYPAPKVDYASPDWGKKLKPLK